uniref:Intraflagellar transport protein 122 homolog n=1 Tax=Caenorhabditis tropicalis TaxID=1561998 RepID=A0A1I7V1E5_9PELO
MRLADLFAAFGYCQQAVDCYLKRNQPQKALDVCIEQSQWDLAHSIANGNHLKIVDVFMEKYVEDMQGVSDDKSVGLLGLYMRARKFLDAAKIAFEIANDRREKMKPVADLKKCYVLAAILVEMYRSSSKNAHQITTHPEDVLDDEFGLSMDQIRILETTWRGAEAFHFMMTNRSSSPNLSTPERLSGVSGHCRCLSDDCIGSSKRRTVSYLFSSDDEVGGL